MLRLKSLLSRIVFLHVIAVGLIALLMSITLIWLLSQETRSLHQRSMLDLAKEIGDCLIVSPEGKTTLELPESLKAQFSEKYGRYFYSVWDIDASLIGSSSGDERTNFVRPRNPPTETEYAVGPRKISGVSTLYPKKESNFIIQVGEDLEHQDVITDDIAAAFYIRVGWITVPILLLLLLVDILIFLGAVRPLRRASVEALSISPLRTDVRLSVNSMPSEILPLVEAFNTALDRLDRGFQLQREFTADAAHELRTPLAVLRTRFDLIDNHELRIKSQADIDAMAGIVRQLLEIAELDSMSPMNSGRADLHSIAQDVVATLAPLAFEGGRFLSVVGEAGPVWIDGDAEMLWRAVRNLVENSILHTPAGTSIEVQVEKGGVIRVCDDGLGIPPDQRQKIFQRFWRGNRSSSHRGAGLGLSLVQQIVEAHGGTISVGSTQSGGASFEIQLIPSSGLTSH